MTTKQIKQLVAFSYKNGALSADTVTSLADKLNRHDLKMYINALKQYEKKTNVYITTAYPPTKEEQNSFSSLFPNKQVSYIIDPSLIVGVTITNNDLITERNLKSTLDNVVTYTTEDYDK